MNDDAHKTAPASSASQFESQAEGREISFFREFYEFLRSNKKWWLSPILVAVALLTFLVALSLSPAAPFIYTLF